ncbi:hypothetical protein WJT86_05420 [Microvirga sp. W0021]|uniref:Uncharacterized protein n=2 Tax=Hohaiivirga grylli TaxID=3133970 RepID=A0ABV0BHR6_9HYPH
MKEYGQCVGRSFAINVSKSDDRDLSAELAFTACKTEYDVVHKLLEIEFGERASILVSHTKSIIKKRVIDEHKVSVDSFLESYSVMASVLLYCDNVNADYTLDLMKKTKNLISKLDARYQDIQAFDRDTINKINAMGELAQNSEKIFCQSMKQDLDKLGFKLIFEK